MSARTLLQESDTSLDKEIAQLEAELLLMKGEADRLREMCVRFIIAYSSKNGSTREFPVGSMMEVYYLIVRC